MPLSWESLSWDWFRRVPLIGGLVECDRDDHWKAVQQTFIVLVLSTMEIWLGWMIVLALRDPSAPISVGMAFKNTIWKAEFFMHSNALLAPIFWVALANPKGAKEFPSKISHMILVTIINSISAVFFGLTTAGQRLDPKVTFPLSLFIFASSLGLLYLGTVYNEHRMPNAPEVYRLQQEEFAEKFEEHQQ